MPTLKQLLDDQRAYTAAVESELLDAHEARETLEHYADALEEQLANLEQDYAVEVGAADEVLDGQEREIRALSSEANELARLLSAAEQDRDLFRAGFRQSTETVRALVAAIEQARAAELRATSRTIFGRTLAIINVTPAEQAAADAARVAISTALARNPSAPEYAAGRTAGTPCA